jgi:hypothetical protein
MAVKTHPRQRDFKNYIRLSRNGRNSRRFSRLEALNIVRRPKADFLYKMKDFLTDNFISWFVHNWWIKKRCAYPPVIRDSVYDMEKLAGAPGPITLCVAADWASGTDQAAYIGAVMQEKAPDYTIHLGDTYYSGTATELNSNFGDAPNFASSLWPRGKSGSFALAGNHEMFSSGAPFFDMILAKNRGFGIFDPLQQTYTGQEACCFCLRTDSWCILALDTGYDSLKQKLLQRIFDRHPDNLALRLPDPVINWLRDVVKIKEEKRGIIVLTHHQYMSAFNGEDEFPGPAAQLKENLPDNKEILWIWGHEHRFSMYGKYRLDAGSISAFGRCIGNGAMPDEHSPDRTVDENRAESRRLVLFDHRIADTIGSADGSKMNIGYNGYAKITLEKTKAEITYYAAYGEGIRYRDGRESAQVREIWEANTEDGTMDCLEVKDFTLSNEQNDRLTYYHEPSDPTLIAR